MNKVGPHSSHSTLTVTLAWEHPFPVEIAHNIRTKVPQSTLPLPPYRPAHHCDGNSASYTP